MDTFFISHGSPMLPLDETTPAGPFLRSWRENILEPRPNAILVVSAHWQTTDPSVNSVEQNRTIHDFDGFPESLYQIQYPAPGSPELAKKVKELLTKAGFASVVENNSRGLDHGAWVPLMLMYPEGDIPICQLSVQSRLDASHHYRMGKALTPLRDDGILIIGSGSATHNLRAVRYDNGPIFPWALEFDTWLKDALMDGRHDDVNHYLDRAPHARTAHPFPDHLYPLHVALGAAGETAKAELIHTSWEDGSLSYASYRFTNTQN